MRERRPLFGYGLQRSGMSAVYHSVCERVDFSIRFDTLWHSCGISTRQWKGYTAISFTNSLQSCSANENSWTQDIRLRKECV